MGQATLTDKKGGLVVVKSEDIDRIVEYTLPGNKPGAAIYKKDKTRVVVRQTIAQVQDALKILPDSSPDKYLQATDRVDPDDDDDGDVPVGA